MISSWWVRALMRLRISPNLALPLLPGADISQAHSAGRGLHIVQRRGISTRREQQGSRQGAAGGADSRGVSQ